MPNEIRYYECRHIGLSGTTGCIIRQSPEGFEARMGIAIFGTTNMSEDDFRHCGYDPFHDDFHDNYAEGKGATEEEALGALKKDMEQIHETLWV